MISPASVEDADRAAALLRVSFPDRLATAAGVRHSFTCARPEDATAWWRAEVGSALVGWAYGGLDAFAATRTAGFMGLVVHPDRRRKGIGSALWAAVSSHLETIGARRIVAYSQGDDDTRAFVAGRGFSLEATVSTSALDPRSLGAAPPPSGGVELRPLSAFLDDPDAVYAADRESFLDEPGPSDFSGTTFDSWHRIIWDHPDHDHDLGIAALAGGTVVGMTFLFADRATGRAVNSGTGVIRSFRGCGLGLLMKHHSLARAAAAGITRVVTQNDDTNAPMLAINARLGYEPFTVEYGWVLER